MEIRNIGKIGGGQDGAIYKGIAFRFDHLGNGAAFDLSAVREGEKTEPFATFCLDKCDILAPHSNAVFFGTHFYEEGDEFPLLYSNIYNNYADAPDPLYGVCLVYRLLRDGESFKTVLVQMIGIGFVENTALWRATEQAHGKRPYGNFLIDRKTNAYYAYVMRNAEKGTRYFKFNIPAPTAGEIDPTYGVPRVTLGEEDILDFFDCPYHYFIQGGIAHDGKIYSTEGFTSEENRPAIRIVDLEKRAQTAYIDLWGMGYRNEPEMIDFLDGVCYYSDAHGNLFTADI